MKLQTLVCECGKTYQQNSYNQKHCSACAYAINVQKGIERARAKRLAQKTIKENQAS